MFSLVMLKFYECFNLIKENKNLTKTSNNQLVIIDVQAKMIEIQKDELREQKELYQKLLQSNFNFYENFKTNRN
jgi:DNA gyrase/topoisomerase IV subunit A